jgi:hypothetical protein
MTSNATVKRIFLRRSSILKILAIVPGSRAAAADNLLLGGLAEFVGCHLESLGQLAVAEDLDPAGGTPDQACLRELLHPNLGPILESLQLCHVHYFKTGGKVLVIEPAFGQMAEHGNLAAGVERVPLGARPAEASLAPPAGRLAQAGASTSSHPLTRLMLADDRSYFMT